MNDSRRPQSGTLLYRGCKEDLTMETMPPRQRAMKLNMAAPPPAPDDDPYAPVRVPFEGSDGRADRAGALCRGQAARSEQAAPEE